MVNIAAKRPIWKLVDIQTLVESDEFDVVNRRGRDRMLSLDWKMDTLKAFILCLNDRHYHKSFVAQAAYDGRKFLDVDAYKMHFDEDGVCEGSSNHCCFYTKLAIDQVTPQHRVAVVTIHLDG